MRLIKIFTLILFSVTFFSTQAQEHTAADLKAWAEENFNDGNYRIAGNLYTTLKTMHGIDVTENITLCDECNKLQKEAKTYESNKQFDKATERYDKLLKLNPNDTEALIFIGMHANGNSQYIPSNQSENYIVEVLDYNNKKFLVFVRKDLREMTYSEALDLCSRLTVGGKTGWRLISANEIRFYFLDYPEEANTSTWVGPEGITVGGQQISAYDKGGRVRYAPFVGKMDPKDNDYILDIKKHMYNNRGELIKGDNTPRRFIAVRDAD